MLNHQELKAKIHEFLAKSNNIAYIVSDYDISPALNLPMKEVPAIQQALFELNQEEKVHSSWHGDAMFASCRRNYGA